MYSEVLDSIQVCGGIFLMVGIRHFSVCTRVDKSVISLHTGVVQDWLMAKYGCRNVEDFRESVYKTERGIAANMLSKANFNL